MYQALYRTERPETFQGVLGQEHIVRVLKNQIAAGTVGHAYLFCGTRGTGKTTVARLLAKAVNCTGGEGSQEAERPCGKCPNCLSIKAGTFVDVIEIDAASNNGVENVRELRESVNYPPSVGRRKVYIIDEVHMLTVPAFNALLKTLEEPPENILFILATTDPQKLPQTILSRCMRFDFRRVPEGVIAEDMQRICGERGIAITEDAVRLLANNADGSVRDGLSLLDQCLAGADGVIDRASVLDCLGAASGEFYLNLTEKVLGRDTAAALIALDDVMRDGKDIRQLLADWLAHYRALLIGKFIKDPGDILNMSRENAARVVEQSRRAELSDINSGIKTIAQTMNDAQYSTQPRTLMELAIVTLSSGLGEDQQPAPMMRSMRAIKNQMAMEGAAPVEAATTEVAAAEAEQQPAEQQPAEQPAEPAYEQQPAEQPAATQDNLASQNTQANQDNLTDLDDLWEDMWETLGDDIGSLYLVRINSSLAALGEKEFKVIISNDFIKTLAENHYDIISGAMARLVGRPLKMVTKLLEAEEEEDEGSVSPEDIAAQLAEKFNINTRIE